MIHLHVTLIVNPAMISTFMDSARVLKQETRRETGNHRFEVYQNQDRLEEFTLLESYVDDEALNAHLDSDHFQTWKVATELMVESSSSSQLIAIE